MTTTPRIDPREVLALVPFQLGFAPDNSLVVVSLIARPDGRPAAGQIRRIDLHPDVDLDALRGWALPTENPAGHIALVYTDDTARAEEVLANLTQAAAEQIRAAYIVTQDGWYDTATQARELQPMPDPAETVIGARMILRDEQVAPSREALFGQDG